jgi:hypothetical protein
LLKTHWATRALYQDERIQEEQVAFLTTWMENWENSFEL